MQNIETWQANSSTGNSPMAIKKFPFLANSLVSSPHLLDFNMLVILSLKNVKQGHKRELAYLYACWIMHMKCCQQTSKRNARWQEKLLLWGRSGTQYVALVTKLSTSHCGAHLVELYCNESNISDTNWLRYLFSSYLKKSG